MNVDSGKETAEADEVVEVVDVVRACTSNQKIELKYPSMVALSDLRLM